MTTDTDFLAWVLNDGEWHSHTEILERSFNVRGCGLTIHSRAADLRKRGLQVVVDLRRNRGRTLSFYRLLNEAAPSTLLRSTPRTPSQGTGSGAASLSIPASNPCSPSGSPLEEPDDHGAWDGAGVLTLFEAAL